MVYVILHHMLAQQRGGECENTKVTQHKNHTHYVAIALAIFHTFVFLFLHTTCYICLTLILYVRFWSGKSVMRGFCKYQQPNNHPSRLLPDGEYLIALA